jgi:hypothetical protein
MGKSESELLAKLESWLSNQDQPPTIFDIIRSGDGDLFAAYTLIKFRRAARKAALENIWIDADIARPGDHETGELFQAFDGLAARWKLSGAERLNLLGLGDDEALVRLRAMPLEDVPIGVTERIATVLSIARSIRSLLPRPAAADGWVRKPNKAPSFSGRSALEVMLSDGIPGVHLVRSYLLAELYGN